jgi:hypothetical protein
MLSQLKNTIWPIRHVVLPLTFHVSSVSADQAAGLHCGVFRPPDCPSIVDRTEAPFSLSETVCIFVDSLAEPQYSRVWEPTNWPQRGTKPGPPGCSGPAQALLRRCTASAQGKAATAQGGGPNWSWGKKILCPTIGVFLCIIRLTVSSLMGPKINARQQRHVGALGSTWVRHRRGGSPRLTSAHLCGTRRG